MLKGISFIVLILSIFSIKAYAHGYYSVNQCANNISAQSYRSARQWGIRAVNNHPSSFGARLCLGIADDKLGLYKDALIDCKQSIPLATNKNRLMLAYNWIGSVFYNIGDNKNALMYYSKSLTLARELGDIHSESSDINNIALIYSNEDKYLKALYYFKKSLSLATTKKGRAISYNNIGAVYLGMKNYAKAIEYQTNALNLDESIGNYYGTAQDYLNLGDEYILTKNYPLSERYILKSITMEKKIGNKEWLAEGYGSLCKLYIIEKILDKALHYCQKAYSLFIISGDSGNSQYCLNEITEIENIQKQDEKKEVVAPMPEHVGLP